MTAENKAEIPVVNCKVGETIPKDQGEPYCEKFNNGTGALIYVVIDRQANEATCKAPCIHIDGKK